MRALLVVVLFGPLLAGCLTSPQAAPDPQDPVVLKRASLLTTSIRPADIVAEGAAMTLLPDGIVRLVWNGTVAGTFRHELTIPPEALAMRARYVVNGGGSMSLVEPKSGNTRCFTTTSLAPNPGGKGYVTCTGTTVIDTDLERPINYSLATTGGTAATQNTPAVTQPYELTLDLIPGPLDGPAGLLNLGALAARQYGIAPQTQHYVSSSSDGARIFVEVNLPDGDGPWPTVFISSPYNQPVRDAGLLTQGARVRDFVPRGYALVVADVRGFANSEGCVEVWGPKEQQDQYDVVEWIAAQPWSDGKVAMYGQSYVGTTPHEAAVLRAPHLVAIATVAGLTDPYFDWHYGGVPNGESSGSPVAYSAATDQPPAPPESPEYVPDWVNLARTQGCGLPELIVGANDPNALYGEYYRVRNLSARAHEIRVPVLYTQGYIDGNVKVAMALDFFDPIPTEKIGIFGPWLHRHPPRGDFDLLLHAWMDRWLQDRPTNVEAYPTVQAMTNADTLRLGEEWPPREATPLVFYPDISGGTLGTSPPPSKAQAEHVAFVGPMAGTQLRFESEPVAERFYVAGEPRVDFHARVQGGDNAHFQARLYDLDPNGVQVQVSFGMLNAALRNSYERYDPMPQDTDVLLHLQMLPTEYVVEAGHRLVLVLGPSSSQFSVARPAQVTITTDDKSGLVLPVLEHAGETPAPISVLGFEAFRTRTA